MENQIQQKPIPNSCTKKEFCKMYYPMPAKELIDELNTIIYDYRKELPKYIGKSRSEIVATKTVKKPEIMIFIKNNFMPNGYE